MITELLTTIALLCQVNTGMEQPLGEINRYQLSCQKEYIKCVSTNVIKQDYPKALIDCILNK
jgi:hypothetical protein